MWQRHTQWRDLSATSDASAAGCGSWTITTSQSSDSSRALISLYSRQVSHCSSVRSCSEPWSALCITLVALKNSSRP